jgi:hypothetical protein
MGIGDPPTFDASKVGYGSDSRTEEMPMNDRTARWIAGPLAALAIGCGALAAHGQAPMPQQQMLGDVAYLNGGAGDEEVRFIRQSMKDYTLSLAFARGSAPSEYVASVAVTIKDAKGQTVFETPSAGPYLLVRLPPGKYSVVADYHDVSMTRPVTAGKSGGALVTFVWK